MTNKILVIGSANTDMVVKTHRFPEAGETIIGGDFFMFAGGKGANQAVAAARLGADVTFVCKIGNDIFGKNAIEGYQKEGINTDYILVDTSKPSGVALILINAEGQNEIVVASGANASLSEENIEMIIEQFQYTEIIVIQLETPIATVAKIATTARKKGKKLIINPAPAQVLPLSIYEDLFLITPNETETEILTNIKVIDENSALLAARKLQSWGVQNVIITMGAQGAFVLANNCEGIIPTPKVEAIDTTAAGDVFNGAIAVALAKGLSWREACHFACKASAISVTRMGAQASAPYLRELSI
ncbi:MAG: ribokinase [Thermoflexibacter sp.]|jgi:ribokinase|nr:ribokinase [Thermoflexibacter sp.]